MASYRLACTFSYSCRYYPTYRAGLARKLKLSNEPEQLNQVHGNNIIRLGSQNNPEATTGASGGGYSTEASICVCVVITADCLPLLLCNDEGTQVAAIHIGWKGFIQNIITAALDKFICPNEKIMAWLGLGPCICAEYYATGIEIHNACLAVFSEVKKAFSAY